MNKYTYQTNAASEMYESMLSGNYEASVLAACPNAGKTVIMKHIINLFTNSHPDIKITIVAHNQNLLVDQIKEVLKNDIAKLSIDINSITVLTAKSFYKNSYKIKTDLLIVDEAHQYVNEKMMDKAIEQSNPQFKLFMTGSPSYYIRYNNAVFLSFKNIKKYHLKFISAEELMENDIFSPVDINVISETDLNNQVLKSIDFLNKNNYNSEKLMVVAKDNNQALLLLDIFKKLNRNVCVSTSHNDTEGVVISRFINNEFDTLIVVNRGILGFSDNNITALLDFKNSGNIENRFQLMARVFRKKENIKKIYLSVTNEDNVKKQKQIIVNTLKLINKNFFNNFDGLSY